MTDSPLYRFLDTVGDGSGTKPAIGNYASAATRFKITPQPGEVYHINRLIAHYEDTTNPSAEEYGNIGAALTNGITAGIYSAADDSLITDLTDGLPIKTNSHWGRFCYDDSLDNYGAGNDYVKVRWTFGSAGRPLIIEEIYYLAVILNDDFTGLLDQTFMVQGFKNS